MSSLHSRFLFLILTQTLIGCGTSVPYKSSPIQPAQTNPSPIYIAPIQSTNAVKDLSSAEFEANTSERRAFFDMNTADCRTDSGQRGIFVIGLGSKSVVKEKGIVQGDRLISINNRHPQNTQELVYIIHRTTPNTMQEMVFERNDTQKNISVFPPTWIPSEQQRKAADTPYQTNQNPCRRINRVGY